MLYDPLFHICDIYAGILRFCSGGVSGCLPDFNKCTGSTGGAKLEAPTRFAWSNMNSCKCLYIFGRGLLACSDL